MRGRKPKPTNLKILQGNPGKRRFNPDEPKLIPEVPSCPDWLDDKAQQEWHRLVPVLQKAGLLTIIDGMALAAFCALLSRWAQAEDAIRREGMMLTTPNGCVQKNPAVTIARECLQLIRTFCTEFGLTPSSRAKVSVAEVPEADGKKLFEF